MSIPLLIGEPSPTGKKEERMEARVGVYPLLIGEPSPTLQLGARSCKEAL